MVQIYSFTEHSTRDDDRDYALIFGKVIKDGYPHIQVSYVSDEDQLPSFLHEHSTDLLFLDLICLAKAGTNACGK